jgi:hypothetical protein
MTLASISNSPSNDNSETTREAPHNMEAEQALLGAILTNNDALNHVGTTLQPEDFLRRAASAYLSRGIAI